MILDRVLIVMSLCSAILRDGFDRCSSHSCRINGMVGHCKVLNQDGKFGFAAPYILHDSLVELVLYYKDHSLASHNPQLNTRLVFPINQRS